MPELFKDVSPDVVQKTEEPVTEAPKVEQSPEDKKLAETFQRISKQEAHLKSERQKIEEARKAFESDKEKAEKYSSLTGKDPFEILEHFGISYEKLLEADKARANPIDPTVKRALDEVQQLKSSLNLKEEEAAKERRTRAELQIKADIAKTIKENDFDVIELVGAQDSVLEYMEEMYSQTGEIPDHKEACQVVANSILEQYQKLSSSKLIKAKEIPAPEAETKQAASQTISQKMGQSTVSKPKVLSESERFQAALQALKAANG